MKIMFDNLKHAYRKVLRYKIDVKNRARLKADKFTIISSNCLGGVIYHDLGLKFLSPTINLWFIPSDFIKFANNIHRYIEQETLLENKDLTEEFGYPVGELGDIKIFFMHYDNFCDASEKWHERSKRIVWDNLFFTLCESKRCTQKDIENFDKLPFEHKVVFTSRIMNEIPSSCCLPGTSLPDGSIKPIMEFKGKFTRKRWIDDFDYVSWLNQEK